ncbi:MAG: hypothetical protein ABJA64_00520 [Candidatus Saccharibacteria bacterium]
MKAKFFKHSLSLGILIVCVAVSGLLVLNRDYVVDQLINWQYKPSQQVASIAKQANMSDTGMFYFYVSQPQVESNQKFNTECERKEKQSAILGCYSDRRIYIFDIQNAQLNGIEEVTAAHEMLHAAWDRMSTDEKVKIEPLLEVAYQKVKTDELSERMDYYARAQPGERTNELHSILGTEFKDLGPELEAHYAKYFINRDGLVTLHDTYKKIFDGIDQQTAALTAQLQTLGDSIEGLSATYKNDVGQLNTDIASFNSRAKSGVFASKDSLNAERSALVARTAQLEANRTDINAKVAIYESLRTQLEAINAQSTALNRSLDSTLAPAPSV